MIKFLHKDRGYKGLKVLIVDGSASFGEALASSLAHTFEAEYCCDGIKAPKVIQSFQPDILIMATILPGNDGFHILQAVQAAGLHPYVLMLTPLISDYVMERAGELKVNYMMAKPCNLQAVVSCVHTFCERMEGELHTEDWYTTMAKQLLLTLNFRTNLSGYHYLLDAVTYLQKDIQQSLTKELYPAVARDCGSSWQQVEHGIRIAIRDAWQSRDDSVWSLYFPPEKNGKIPKPTNSKLLTRLAECLLSMDNSSEDVQNKTII